VLQQVSVVTSMRFRSVLFKWGTLQFLLSFAIIRNTDSDLYIIFVIIGDFDEMRTRSGLIQLILQPKLRERKETNNL